VAAHTRVFCESIRIDAPAERVWAVMSDLAHWPEWTPTFSEVRQLGSPLGVGARYRVKQPRLPATVMTVVQWQPAQGFTWQSSSLGLRATGVHRIEPDGLHACTVLLQMAFDGLLARPVAFLLRGLVQEYVRSEAHALKLCCERDLR